MSAPYALNLYPQSRTGSWKLPARRAVTLNATQDAQLRVTHGGLWVTLGGIPPGPGNASGDYFLAQGQVLTVPAGSCAVIEHWGRQAQADVYFAWDALASTAQPPVRVASGWQLGVGQPLADLRAAGALAGAALVRLVAGLAALAAGFTSDLLAGAARAFGRGAGFRALTAASSANAAQRCISAGDSMASSGTV